MQLLYTARERYGPQDGAGWANYIAWCGLTQLDEVVTLDGMLCPEVADIRDDYSEGFWAHQPASPGVERGWFVSDLGYLLAQLSSRTDCNILAVVHEPTAEPSAIVERLDFAFVGYDLIEREGYVSALTNCGGFPESFSNAELTSKGLLPSLARARQVQSDLKRLNPHEAHADCALWAIYRAVAAEDRPP